MWTKLNPLFVIVIITILTSATAIKFNFTIKGTDKRCFSELLTESTPFHFRIEGETENFKISLNHRDGTPLVINERLQKIKKIDSYSSITGQYYFCILNDEYEQRQYTFHFFHGLELSDLSALPRQADSKVIDQVVDRINEAYQSVKEQQSYSRTVNEYNMQLQKQVSFKSVGFVFLSITVVLIISFLHYLEIKRVLKNRKII